MGWGGGAISRMVALVLCTHDRVLQHDIHTLIWIMLSFFLGATSEMVRSRAFYILHNIYVKISLTYCHCVP